MMGEGMGDDKAIEREIFMNFLKEMARLEEERMKKLLQDGDNVRLNRMWEDLKNLKKKNLKVFGTFCMLVLLDGGRMKGHFWEWLYVHKKDEMIEFLKENFEKVTLYMETLKERFIGLRYFKKLLDESGIRYEEVEGRDPKGPGGLGFELVRKENFTKKE